MKFNVRRGSAAAVLWLVFCGLFGLAVTVPANLAVIGYQQPLSHSYLNSLVQSTDLVADLRNFVGATVPSSDSGVTGTVVHVLGQSAVGDSGGGLFFWNASSTAADDGINTIKPISVSGAGRWLRTPTGGLPIANSNAALAAFPAGQFPAVMRLGVNAPGDAPPMRFVPSATACAIPGGDGGTEVPITSGGCMNADAQSFYDVREWPGVTAGPINQYVNAATGNDYSGENSCLIASAPCKNPQEALVWASEVDFAGGSDFVNIAAGSYTGNWLINGPPRGGVNSVLASTSYYWGQSQIILSGAGSGSTTLNGGSAGCYVVLSNAGAWVGLQNLTLSGLGSGCQSELYLQLKGNASLYGDVKFTAASVDLIHMETGSHLEIWSIAGEPDIIAGGGGTFINSGGGELVDNGGAWTVTGSPVFTSAFIEESGGAKILMDVSTAFSGALGGASVGANISDNSILTNHTGTALPTLLGGAVITSNGGRVRPSDGGTITGLNGLGGGSSAAISGGSHGGALTLTTAASGTLASGSFTLSFLDENVSGATGEINSCAFTPNTNWPSTSTVQSANPGATSLSVSWFTNGAALTVSHNYGMIFVCNGD